MQSKAAGSTKDTIICARCGFTPAGIDRAAVKESRSFHLVAKTKILDNVGAHGGTHSWVDWELCSRNTFLKRPEYSGHIHGDSNVYRSVSA